MLEEYRTRKSIMNVLKQNRSDRWTVTTSIRSLFNWIWNKQAATHNKICIYWEWILKWMIQFQRNAQSVFTSALSINVRNKVNISMGLSHTLMLPIPNSIRFYIHRCAAFRLFAFGNFTILNHSTVNEWRDVVVVLLSACCCLRSVQASFWGKSKTYHTSVSRLTHIFLSPKLR